MIKLNLVQFIRQFSFKRVITEYNHLFLQCIGLLFVCLLLTYFCNAAHAWLFHQWEYWEYSSFWERLLFTIGNGRNAGIGIPLNVLINYHILVIVLIKLSKTNQLSEPGLAGRTIESYIFGLLLIMAINIFFSNGMNYFFQRRTVYGDDIFVYRFFSEWLNNIVQYLVPVAGFYLAFHFLNRSLNQKSSDKKFIEFLQITFLYLLIVSFTNFIITVISTLVLQPVGHVFGGNLVGMVLTGFISAALIVFYMVAMSDLMLILLKRKTMPYTPPSNPDLLDM